MFRQTRHTHNRPHNQYDHFGSGIDNDIGNLKFETMEVSNGFRILCKRVLRFSDTDRQMTQPHGFDIFQFFLRSGRKCNAAGIVNFLSHLIRFHFDRVIQIISELQRFRRVLLNRIDNQMSKHFGSFSSFSKGIVNGKTDT